MPFSWLKDQLIMLRNNGVMNMPSFQYGWWSVYKLQLLLLWHFCTTVTSVGRGKIVLCKKFSVQLHKAGCSISEKCLNLFLTITKWCKKPFTVIEHNWRVQPVKPPQFNVMPLPVCSAETRCVVSDETVFVWLMVRASHTWYCFSLYWWDRKSVV